MERKIGEIFEYQGEWYQCLPETNECDDCVFKNESTCINSKVVRGECQGAGRYDDGVIFKKLEKVGEPFYFGKTLMQNYKVFIKPYIPKELEYFTIKSARDLTILIEIKQNKEDMEENKLNLKPFDIQKAREGKPVCTRDGRKARIICFDYKSSDDYSMIALIDIGDNEIPYKYTKEGKFKPNRIDAYDLMMLPEKKEGWINIYEDMRIYASEEGAKMAISPERTYITTTKINWEE